MLGRKGLELMELGEGISAIIVWPAVSLSTR
jgi:hypothetical protein